MPDAPSHIVVILNEDLFDAVGLDSITESKWQKSAYPGYSYRVDPARPEMQHKRHVHIAQTKHTRAKNKQVSWNDDKTRHDKKSFNTSFKSFAAAQEIAREVLGLPDDAVLESARHVERLHLLVEGVMDEVVEPAKALPDPIVLECSL